MAAGLSIVAVVFAAIVFFKWQLGLPKKVEALLGETERAHRARNFAAAEKSCLQAAACARRILLRGRSARVTALYDLALLYLQQDKLEQAEQTAVQALGIARRVCAKSSVAASLVALLPQIYKKLGKDLSACPVFEVSIPLLRARHGADSIQVGTALHELGVTYSRIGVPERAIEALKECLPIFEKRLGAGHHDVGSALVNLGKAQSQAKRYADAERSYRASIAIHEANGGANDPEVALVLNNLAVTLKQQERIPEALECLRRSLAIREARLGPNHPQVGLVLNNIANCLRLQRKYDEAEAAVTRAKAILESPPHPSYATVLDSFASLRAAQGRYEEADALFTQCLKIHEGRPSSNLIELAETCERYADVLYKLQREQQGDAMLERVNDLRAARDRLALLPAA